VTTAPITLDALGASPDGAEILDEVQGHLGRFVVYPSTHGLVAATLWVAHAHALDCWESTPRLAHLSPEPGSGKSRALEVIASLVPAPMHAVNATPAALFRAVSDLEARPTILFDEIDTVFGPHAKENEAVRGFLNAGHRRGADAYRCVGEGTRQKVTAFPAFCAVALAGLNDLPDTIATRSVIIRMRRRAEHERVSPYRARVNEGQGHEIRDRLAGWVATVTDSLADAWPTMPPGVEDRPADVWEPLLAIADAAGGSWPDVAREACIALTTEGTEREPSLGVRLLSDLRAIWQEDGDPLAMHTETMLERLHSVDEGPWADLRGKPLDARYLAKLLNRYDVRREQVNVAGKSAKGYRRDPLFDAWARYLPREEAPPPPCRMGNEGNPGNPDGDALTEAATDVTDVTDVTHVPGRGEGSGTGPCVRCGTSTHRYGDGASGPLCQDCRTAA